MLHRIRELHQEGGIRSVMAGISRFGYYDVFPKRLRRLLVSGYVSLMHRINRDYVTFEYENDTHRIYFTAQTVSQIRNLVVDQEITREHIPLSAIDSEEAVDAVIDVGAHIGLYSVLLKRLHPDADLYSFEPGDENRTVLTNLLRVNEISGTILNEIVSGETGSMKFYLDSEKQSESHSTTAKEGFTTVEKSCIALSDFFESEDINRAFLKIDAEGEESDIINDLQTTNIQYLEGVVEIHPDKLDIPASQVVEQLKQASNQFEFLADTSPQHSVERPMYHFVMRGD